MDYKEFDTAENIVLPVQMSSDTSLAPGELVSATPVPVTWNSSSWCQVWPMESDEYPINPELAYSSYYTKTDFLEALTANQLNRGKQKPDKGLAESKVEIEDSFGMSYLELWDMPITDKKNKETVLWSRWVRNPGTVGCSIYRVRDGKPCWLFARVLQRIMWCDPLIEILPATATRRQAQIIAFQPPFWPLVYKWNGYRFTALSLSRDAFMILPRMVLMSYRRWLILGFVFIMILAVFSFIGRKMPSTQIGMV